VQDVLILNRIPHGGVVLLLGIAVVLLPKSVVIQVLQGPLVRGTLASTQEGEEGQ
jgi:hypothetical protein